MIAYVSDDGLRAKENDRRRNFWDAYIEEILCLIGASAKKLSLQDLADKAALNGIDALIIGSVCGANLVPPVMDNIRDWVKSGGLLIGFKPEGLDDIFGIIPSGKVAQSPDDYAVSGKFELIPQDLTRELHPLLMMQQKLLILSDIQKITTVEDVKEVAYLYGPDEEYLGGPAITWRQSGKGYAAYFGFDAAKTVWLLHQGRPIPECAPEERYPKTRNLCILGNNSRLVRYADEICFLIQNILARKQQPFIYQIPPMGQDVPDALLYWSGDEYNGPVEHSLFASDFMKGLGLPFHINIEVERHPMSQKEYDHIVKENGHEISAYWQMYERENCDVRREHFLKQADEFRERFDKSPGSTLLWSTKWKGWTEPARWMAEAGALADNTFCNNGIRYTLDAEDGRGRQYHPYGNVGSFSFGFGTSYPFHFYEDYARQNRRIENFTEQPIACYETGNRSGTRPESDLKTIAREDVRMPIDWAVKHHLVINVFYHPGNIHKSVAAQEAIKEAVRYINYIGARVLHLGADGAAEWWNARTDSSVRKISENEIEYDCKYTKGMIVKLPAENEIKSVRSQSGGDLGFDIKEEFGFRWLFVIVPPGAGKITIA